MEVGLRRKISAGMKRHIKLILPACRCYVHRSKAEGMSSETRAKIGAANSKALKGKKLSKQHKEAVSRGMLGRKVSAETREKIAKAQRGKPRPAGSGHHQPHTDETKKRLSDTKRRHAALDLPTCRCYVHGAKTPNNPSLLSWKMVAFLDAAGFSVIIPEQQFGRYRVDALLAEEWLAFEADGNGWHNAEYDEKRDKFLLENFALPVVRLTQKEIQAWPR